MVLSQLSIFQLETRPVVILSLLSTQETANGYKETVVSVNLSNTFTNITPGIPWLQDLQSVLSSPPGVSILFVTWGSHRSHLAFLQVFENVVPSDSTKISVAAQDCVVLLPAVTRHGAISIDIGNCSLKTRLLASTPKRAIDLNLAEIAISLSDNYGITTQRKPGAAIAEVRFSR